MSVFRNVSGARCQRLVLALALALALAGCDRCGDWWRPIKFPAQACKDDAPKPQ